MTEPLRCVSPETILTGWDFSTGAVKCLAFDLDGRTLAEVRLPTDLWTAGGVSELNLMQLAGQARASTRALAARLREQGRLSHWVAGGVSATHHTAGRIDADRVPVRRAICWNDHTLAAYHARGLAWATEKEPSPISPRPSDSTRKMPPPSDAAPSPGGRSRNSTRPSLISPRPSESTRNSLSPTASAAPRDPRSGRIPR